MSEETTPPETTPEVEASATDPKAELEKLQAKYERAQKDLEKFRTRASEVEAAQKKAEEEALRQKTLEEQLEAYKGKQSEAETKLKEAEARALQAERLAQLAGKVADPKAALKLIDESHLTDEGVSVEALLASYPFLAPQKGTPGLDGPNPPGGGRIDPANMSKEQFNELQQRALAGERVTLK